jgi:tetratricopeptide (TPR) repeat protein/transcriptional regulator with XRE-family HTH domain
MVRHVNGAAHNEADLDVAGPQTLQDLAGVLRALRRRHARQCRAGELTYRELAARTGWSTGAIAEYLSGRILPPTDRFDVLVGLLGATPIEQGALATARDRVAENQRRPAQAGDAARRVPRQLPADVFAFTGRGDQLADLDALLAGPPGAAPTAVVISAISGTAGVGKTALAVHWAHRVADRFPDGQLFVNLRGYDPERPVPPGDALARLLSALGVPDADVPLDVEDRAARYRSQLADRRMLIVLDNAGSVDQVRPLLPGTPSCSVVVTSRDSLAGLVARDGARRLDLGLLPLPDAVALLSQLIGPRARTEPGAVTTLANLCARLPLALRIAAELAVSRPTTCLAGLASELADRQRRLDLLDAGGDPRATVTAVFSWSFQHLTRPAARTFRLLSLHPGADLDGYAVAALAGTDLATARRDLDTLARAHLIHATGPGRYGMHDLLRAYAAELVSVADTDDERRAARSRLLDTYLATAHAAMGLVHGPDIGRRQVPTPVPTTPMIDLPDADAAHAWLDVERPNLVAIAAYTATGGWPAYTVDLATTLCRYLDGGHHTDALTIHTHAHRAAELIGDETRQAQALVDLGCTHLRLSQYDEAAGPLHRALTLFQRVGDRSGQSHALDTLGKLEGSRGQPEAATRYLRQALALAGQAGNLTGQAHALADLASVEVQLGRYDTAIGYLEQALTLVTNAGSRFGEAAVLNNLGLVEQRLGHYEAASEHLQRALAAFRLFGHRQGEASTLDNLGSVHIGLGRPLQAIEYFTQALRTFREIGDRVNQAMALSGLGEATRSAGRLAEAVAHHAEALAIATDVGARWPQARAHLGLGEAYHALGDLTLARHHLQHAVTAYDDLKSVEADDARALLAALPARAGD